MTLRMAAALAVLIGVATFGLYLHLLGKAPWSVAGERHLRALKDRRDAPAVATPMSLPAFAELPRGISLAERAPYEKRGVVVEGYVQRMLRALDGDYHLDLAPEAQPGYEKYVPYVVAEVTPAWQRRVPAWSYDRLIERFRPPRGGVTGWDDGPRRVRLTGWLMYDQPHETRPLRRRYPDALTAWEVHPVTRIEVWSETAGRYEDYR